MSSSLPYDLALVLIPEALNILRDYEHPRKAELFKAGESLRLFIASAYERLRGTPLPPELQRFREVMRFGFLALKRLFSEGDWRSRILFEELLLEVDHVKSLLEWLLQAPALPQRPSVVEVGSVAPLYSVRLAVRLGARVTLVQERSLAAVQVVREVGEEYFRRYGIDGRILDVESLASLGQLRESADAVFFGSIEAWRAGWDGILSAAATVLKPRGVLSCLLPGNYREGMRTLLLFWDVPPYPEPSEAAARLRAAGFRDVRVSSQGCFYAVTALKR